MGNFKRAGFKRSDFEKNGRPPENEGRGEFRRRKFDRFDNSEDRFSRRRDSDDRRRPDAGFERREKPEMHMAVCDKCKKECEVPFKPSSDKPIYCRDCFKKESPPRGLNQLDEINMKLDKIMRALKIE